MAADDRPAQGSSPAEKRPFCIVCFSGEYDKLFAAFTIATGAAAMGLSVEMYFSFWAARAMCPLIGRPKPRTAMERIMGFFMPSSPERLPLSRMNFFGLGPILIRRMIRKRKMMDLPELIDAAREQGVKFKLCDASADILGIAGPGSCEAERCGVSTLVEAAARGGSVLFI